MYIGVREDICGQIHQDCSRELQEGDDENKGHMSREVQVMCTLEEHIMALEVGVGVSCDLSSSF